MEPGRNLGKYVVERRLGAGGMATVWLARHGELGSRHAVKVLRESTPAIDERLRQEGRLQATLDHPNVVHVTDALEVDGRPALVLEYVEGPTLATLLASGPLSVREIDHLARGILAGVAAAHTRGWIHRDLKPENVLVRRVGAELVPKVADFGIAKVLCEPEAAFESGTTTRRGLGTRRYMSLEQLTGQTPDSRMDVFALGALLYELCAGRTAFPTVEAWEDAVRHGRTPTPTRPDLPARMVGAIRAALADRAQRPADAGALLALWVGEERVHAPRRRRGWSWAALLLIVPLLIVPPAPLALAPLAPLSDPSRWELFDLMELGAGERLLEGPTSTVVLEPYLYAYVGDLILRYDTRLRLDDTGAWRILDPTQLLGVSMGHGEVRQVGRQVWFHAGNRLACYDADMPFDAPSSWAVVSLEGLVGLDSEALSAVGVQGYDGRHVYFSSGHGGLLLRQDTRAPIEDAGSWETVNVAAYGLPPTQSYRGFAADGRYVYLTPYYDEVGEVWGAVVARYDTTLPFADPSAWSSFATTDIDPRVYGFSGSAFDGRYLYLAPYFSDEAWYHGWAIRGDTRAGLTDASSWETMDLTTLSTNARGYIAALAADRSAFYVPNAGQWGGLVARYDRAGAFTDPSAWSTFDLANLESSAVSFGSGAFDGRYAYFLPYLGPRANPSGRHAIVARFDTSAP